MQGKLRTKIGFHIGIKIPMADSFRALWLCLCANCVLRSNWAQFDIVGRAVSSESLMTRSQPAQDGEDEAAESDQCSQATINDGDVTGIVVDRDQDLLEVGGRRVHGYIVLAGSRTDREYWQVQGWKVFANGTIEVTMEDTVGLLLK